MHSCSLFVGQAVGPIYFITASQAIGATPVLYVNAVVMLAIGPLISYLLLNIRREVMPG
jgi:hypothetical protein